MQELPEHQRSDAVSSMVYEANARVRDPVYGCVGAISSLQQQIDVLQSQLAIAQAEVVHMRMHQLPSTPNHHNGNNPIYTTNLLISENNNNNENNNGSSSTKHNTKSFFTLDMVVDHHQPNIWSY